MPRKAPTKPESREEKASTIGRYDVLDTDGVKTSGLTDTAPIKLKGLDKYKVAVQPVLEPKLKQEKERASRIRYLLDSIHPGSTAPEGISFSGINFAGKDLERVRFTENSLKNCSLREGQLRDSHWKNCDLSGIDFRNADLRNCILDGCNLNGADLRYSNMKNARIIDCNLFAANFDNTVLDGAVMDHCEMGAQSFHNTSCKKLSFYSSHIIHGFFDNVDMTGAELRDIIFRGCTLTNACFQDAVLEGCVFKACDSYQDGPIFSGATFHKVEMIDCELTATQMEDTQFFHCHWERVGMESALFEGTIFTEVNFQKSVLKSCYSLDNSPTFNRCRLDHTIIEQTDFAAAKFSRSLFVGAIIRDSDFSDWELLHTELDVETVVDSD